MSKRWVVQNNVAYALIPKSGSSSIKTTLFNAGHVYYMENDEVDVVDTRVVFLRHPINRIHSAYRFFKNQHELGCKGTGLGIPTDSYESFVDYALTHDDPHWASQMEMVGGMATDLYRFEDLGKAWSLHSDVPLNHRNSAPVYEFDQYYRLADLMNISQQDVDTWMTLTPLEDK